MPDPVVPPAAASALYPDGGNNPKGHPEQALDPATGQPKFTAEPASAVPAAPAPAEPPKAAEPAPAPAEPPKEPAPAEPAAPIDVSAYADLKLPEALTPSEPLFNEFKALAAELKLPPAEAEKLLPFAEKLVRGQVEAIQTAASAEFKRQQDAWVGEIKAMPEFQGEALERNQQFLGRLMDEFASPETKAYLDATGMGNHPGLVKMILAMGQALIEGDPTPVGDPGKLAGPKADGKTGPKTAGAILYPTMTN